MSKRVFVSLCLVFVLGVGVLCYGSWRNWFDGGENQVRETAEGDHGSVAEDSPHDPRWLEALDVKESELTTIGDVIRPSRDVDFKGDAGRSKESTFKSPFAYPGKSPSLKGTENSQVAGLFQELKDPEGPLAARSALFPPEPFDLEAYQAEPEAYLSKIRPGRVFYPAQPAQDVSPLRPKSSKFNKILQGETVVLRVKADPKSPVAFYSSDGVGRFDNQLKSITVAAGEDGIAEVRYTAVAGTVGLQSILAASPLHSQQLKFVVKVALPQ